MRPFSGGCAYDGQGLSDCLAAKFGTNIEVVIPPPKNAVEGSDPRRNRHIEAKAGNGRMAWQTETGYDQRALVEAQIGRWKETIGSSLQATDFECQTADASIAAKAQNQMTDLGRATYERVK